MQVLGLDFAADPNLKEQITSFIDQFHSYESVGVLYFFGAWFVAKLLCIDLLTIVLAFSSGVLFNGLFSGTAISVACSSLASLLIFTITRSFRP